MIPAVVIVLLCVPIASRIEPLVPEEGGEEGGESHLYEYADHHSVHSIQHRTPHTAHRTPYTAPDNSGLSRFFSSFLLLFFPPLSLSLSSLHLDRRHLGIEETRLVRRLPRVLAKEEERRRYTVCEYTRVPGGIYMGDLLCATAHLHRTRYNTTHDRE